MVEQSYYWEGLITGDATLAPYDDFTYANNWNKLFTQQDNEGIVRDYLDELLVSGVTGGVSIESGAAVVKGWLYENTAQETEVIDTPASNPRIDMIVARMIYVNQKVRITVIEGTEAASPTPPSLVQNGNVAWDIPLAQVTITTAGAITVADKRQFCNTPLAERPAMSLIQEVITISEGIPVNVVFDGIPQNFNDLLIVAQWRGTDAGEVAFLLLNDDLTPIGGNYWRQTLSSNGAVVTPAALNRTSSQGLDLTNLIDGQGLAFNIFIKNYSGSTFYKNVLVENTNINATTDQQLTVEGVIWENTEPISRIALIEETGTLLKGSNISLYGI